MTSSFLSTSLFDLLGPFQPNANLLIPRSTTMFGIGGAGGFNEEGEGGLPWARGNPQPKNGLRGSRDWQASQQRVGNDKLAMKWAIVLPWT
jgi:hypothetical protein